MHRAKWALSWCFKLIILQLLYPRAILLTVTVFSTTEGAMRASDGELSPGGSSTPQTSVPTQVVQQVQAAQQVWLYAYDEVTISR